MKIFFSCCFIPADEPIPHADIPGCGAPCQTGNGAAVGKGHIFEMLSNGLGITKIMIFAYKAIEDFLEGSSANLLELDGKQIGKGTVNGRIINGYSGWFFSFCKRIGRGEFPGRQFNEALRFQEKKQASADHVLKNTIRLSPIPLPADFL